MKEMIPEELDLERRRLKLTMKQFNDAIGTSYIAFSDGVDENGIFTNQNGTKVDTKIIENKQNLQNIKKQRETDLKLVNEMLKNLNADLKKHGEKKDFVRNKAYRNNEKILTKLYRIKEKIQDAKNYKILEKYYYGLQEVKRSKDYRLFNNSTKTALSDISEIDKLLALSDTSVDINKVKTDMKARFKNIADIVTKNVGDEANVIQPALAKIVATIDSATSPAQLVSVFESAKKIDVQNVESFKNACDTVLKSAPVATNAWEQGANVVRLNDTEDVEIGEEDMAFNEYINSLGTEDVAIEGETTVEENAEVEEPTAIQDKLTALKEELNTNIETIEDKDLVKQIEEISAKIDELATVELDAQDLLTKVNELKADAETEGGSEEGGAVEGEEGLEDLEV